MSRVVVSFNIPQDASTGKAMIYSNMYSDWPSNGGNPLTGETQGSIKIQ